MLDGEPGQLRCHSMSGGWFEGESMNIWMMNKGRMLSVQLSAKRLADVRFRDDDIFVFRVGDELYKFPRVLAEFLSPRVVRSNGSDATTFELEVNTKANRAIFDKVILISRGYEVEVDLTEALTMISLFGELENSELSSKLYDGVFPASSLNTGNMSERFRLKRSFSCDFEEEVAFVASHFSEMSLNEICEFTIDELDLILRHESLVAVSEDSIYEVISKHLESNYIWFSLFEYVHFEFLSLSSIKHFIELTQTHLHCLTEEVWSRICERLAIDISKSVHPRFPSTPVRCDDTGTVRDFDSNSPLDGIISHLTSRFGGNVSDLGIVSVTSKSVNGDYEAKNAVDLTTDSKFGSSSPGEDEWLCYDFKARRVEVRHYSIRSQFNQGRGACHPKSWVIEGSVDGDVWVELDRKRDNYELNDKNVIKHWPTTKSMKSRYIRLRQTGKNHGGDYSLWISSFEVFGIITE
jgi:hypothetical protein